MIKRIKYVVFSVVLLLVFTNVNAITKDDVINLASSIKTCSSETSSLVNGFKTTYTRLINERNVSGDNLNKIYNNINQVKSILSSFNVCTKESLSSLPKSVKDELYSLYKQTNKLITSSPKYVDKDDNTSEVIESNDEVKVVIDSSNNAVKIYEGGILIDVISEQQKLNYVGINKGLLCIIFFVASILVFMLALKIKGKKSIFITSIIYVCVFLLFGFIIFKNDISSILNIIQTMNVNITNEEKKVSVKDKKIISYPSYGSKYAKVYINEKNEDLYFGDSSDILSKGVGQTTKSSLPGEEGLTILSGHNAGLFNELFDLSKNDEVTIETVYGRFKYKVLDKKVINDTDVDEIYKDYDLVLYTCYPNDNIYGNKRLVIYLNLFSSEWLGDNNEK